MFLDFDLKKRFKTKTRNTGKRHEKINMYQVLLIMADDLMAHRLILCLIEHRTMNAVRRVACQLNAI